MRWLSALMLIALAAALLAVDSPTLKVQKSQLEPLNALSFGAVGDGQADDTAALQKAVSQAPVSYTHLRAHET